MPAVNVHVSSDVTSKTLCEVHGDYEQNVGMVDDDADFSSTVPADFGEVISDVFAKETLKETVGGSRLWPLIVRSSSRLYSGI